MEYFEMTKNKVDTSNQLDFLINLEFKNVFRKCRHYATWLIGLTFLYILILVFSDSEKYLPLKGVSTIMLTLGWICASTYLAIPFTKYLSRKKWKRSTISAYQAEKSTELRFDNDSISYRTNKYNTELKWEYFNFFKEHKNSIFIFDNVSIYNALYFSENELGIDNYAKLKTIVIGKLTPLS
jgi:hypothetical protein